MHKEMPSKEVDSVYTMSLGEEANVKNDAEDALRPPWQRIEALQNECDHIEPHACGLSDESLPADS